MNKLEFFEKLNSLLYFSVEQGYSHPIEDFLNQFSIEYLNEYLNEYYFITNDVNKASIILVIGRLNHDKSKLKEILFDGINHTKLEIRDHTVCTAEHCGFLGLEILKKSNETVPYLIKYIEGVKKDLAKNETY